jgi:hypothetical protein
VARHARGRFERRDTDAEDGGRRHDRLVVVGPWVAAGELGRTGERPQIIAFDGADLTGDHTHLVGEMWRLGMWDSSISSRIVLSGTWECFDDDEFTGTKMAT